MHGNLIKLKPTMQSACPHVLTHIVTRNMVDKGDPLPRGCDQSESYGANFKFDIHNRCFDFDRVF